MENVARSLKEAQNTAAALFDATVGHGLIRAGKLESELTQDIHELARSEFGLRRHWHKRIVRAGSNTLLTYYDDSEDRRIGEDDVVYLDFGPVFDEWEADFGRTYVLGADPEKHRLVADLADAFAQGRALYERSPELTCGGLYDFVRGLAAPKGWEFGAPTAGHLIGHFPHEVPKGDPARYKIRHGNDTKLRHPAPDGTTLHWILEIHFIDRARKIGGFYEELLTV